MANDLNGQSFTIESASGSVFTLSDTVFDGVYTSGGTWSQDGFGATAGDYVFGYRYIDDTTTAVPSSLTGLTKITALENDDFTWSSLSTTTEARGQYKLELFRSTAGVTNVLFKVATIASGATGLAFVPFLVVSLVGRSARFFLVAVLLWLFGDSIRRTIERHFDLAALLFLVLLVGGFAVLRLP